MPDPSPPPALSTAAGIRAAALLLAASTLLSRILGYGRDWLIGFEFGATGQTDMYQASFTVPDLINHLLAGGALSVSLLPRMAELYARQDRGEGDPGHADRAFSTVCSAMMVAAVVLVGVAWLAADALVAVWFPGFDQAKRDQTAHLTRIVLPAQLFFLVGGLFQAALLARQRFAAMALTPLLYNAGILVGGLIGGRVGQIEGFSWGALAGALAGGLAVPVWSARHTLRFRFKFAPADPEIRRFLWVAAPLMIGVSLTTVDEWLVKHFGSSLQAGAISWLMTARRVMLVPIGILGSAAGQATGSYLARLHAEGQRDELARVLTRAVAAVTALSLVAAAVLWALALPVVEFLFQYGRFTPHDAARTAEALRPLAWAIPAWGAQQVLARAFYATGDTWRPMAVTTAILVAAVPLYAWAGAAGSGALVGLCIAGAVGMWLQAAGLAVLAWRRLGFRLAAYAGELGKAALAASAGGLCAWALAGSTVRSLCTTCPAPVERAIGLAIAAVPAAAVAVFVAVAVGMAGVPGRLARLRRWGRT
ncbi:MAG: murein biosynthesis integral membrane protein MurJ [Deltaproteobacteria bacterium]|nr:murein biosynthesis integral membrane protein MurJ [Deltaproteobacteria bacterium]